MSPVLRERAEKTCSRREQDREGGEASKKKSKKQL